MVHFHTDFLARVRCSSANAMFDRFPCSQGEESSCPVSVVILLLVKYAPELTVTQVAINITIGINIIIGKIIFSTNFMIRVQPWADWINGGLE